MSEAVRSDLRGILTGATIQPKLAVSRPGDRYEREADAVADKILAGQPVGTISRLQSGSAQEISRRDTPAEEETESVTVPVQRLEGPVEEGDLGNETASRTTDAQLMQDEEIVQTQGSGRGMAGMRVDPQTERRIQAQRGMGDPLPEGFRADMESRLGRGLESVRIHTGAEAGELSSQVRAKAFTVGRDIFFAQGRFSPQSPSGRRLLAHELTHVAQQEHALPRLQRDDSETPAGDETELEGPLTVTDLPIPHFKFISGRYQNARLVRAKEYEREKDTKTYQAHTWDRTVRHAGIAAKLRDTVGMNDPEHTYMVLSRPRKLGSRALGSTPVGDAATIARGLLRPWWTRERRGIWHDVDHVIELQLSGWPRVRTADRVGNYELVDRTANRSSGTRIKNALVDRVRAAVPGTNPKQVMNSRDVVVANVVNSGALTNASRWEKTEIERGDHIDAVLDDSNGSNPVEFLDLDDPSEHGHFSAPRGRLNTENYKGSSNKFVIYHRSTGGNRRDALDYSSAPAGEDSPELARSDKPYVHGFHVQRVVFHRRRAARSEPVGVIHGKVFKQQQGTGRVYSGLDDVAWPVRSMATSDFAGYLDADDLRNLIRFHVAFMSPIRFDSFDLDPKEGLLARGKVLPSLPLLRDADIDIVFAGNDLGLEKRFSVEELHLPPPLHVDACTLGLSLGTRSGLRITGSTDFSIERLGRGSFTASVGAGGEDGMLALDGRFDFASELFDRARVQAWYRDEQLGASGSIGIDSPDKIRGIKAANLDVEFGQGRLTAHGTMDPDVPGLQQGGLDLAYSREEGLTIGGNLKLAEMPGIRSGSIDMTVSKRGDAWRLTGSGEAQPDIPGVDTNLNISYDDGAFTASAFANYNRGMLSGSLRVGVTNCELDTEGNPGEGIGQEIRVYGGGALTVQIAPWLQGTAGVRFLPNGELEVSGEIGLPSDLQIFPRKDIDKSIFDIAVQAPIVPGVVAEVGGGLSAQAGIGPGVIDRLNLGIEYNPAHEENTRVTGGGHLRIPADAGLRLAVRAGIGLGITGASATGGLEIGGTLGIQGAAEAGVEVDWTPATGLELDAEVAVHAQPSFTFDISGYVDVRVLGGSVYDNRWELASFTFGSDYRFGIRLPVHYQEGEPFDISLSDVEFEVPDIDTDRLLKGLIRRIT